MGKIRFVDTRPRTEYATHIAANETLYQFPGHQSRCTGYEECGGAIQPAGDGERGAGGCSCDGADWVEGTGELRIDMIKEVSIKSAGKSACSLVMKINMLSRRVHCCGCSSAEYRRMKIFPLLRQHSTHCKADNVGPDHDSACKAGSYAHSKGELLCGHWYYRPSHRSTNLST